MPDDIGTVRIIALPPLYTKSDRSSQSAVYPEMKGHARSNAQFPPRFPLLIQHVVFQYRELVPVFPDDVFFPPIA